MLGMAGKVTHGFAGRFDIAALPQPWTGIQCHGAASLAALPQPLATCLGDSGNQRPGDIYLLGDSHAAQLTFPLGELARQRHRQLWFINSEAKTDFPYAYWRHPVMSPDPILAQVIANADAGDNIVIAFHRGRLNDKRDAHIPLAVAVSENDKSRVFFQNMQRHLPALLATGANVYLIKDSPLLAGSLSLERCAWFSAGGDTRHCAVTRQQDLHTRWRQDQVFDALATQFDRVQVLDIQPVLYAGREMFNPIDDAGGYRMFDTHHLTEATALTLLPYFSLSIPLSAEDGEPLVDSSGADAQQVTDQVNLSAEAVLVQH